METVIPNPLNSINKTATGGSNKILIGIIIVLAILLLISIVSNPLSFFKPSGGLMEPKNLLVTNFSATVLGKVTKVSGKTLTIVNSLGVTGELTAADNVMIMGSTTGTLLAPTPTSDLSKIELNTDSNIFLSSINGELFVTSITPMPTASAAGATPPPIDPGPAGEAGAPPTATISAQESVDQN